MPTSNDLVAETAIIRKKLKQGLVHVKALPSVRILAKQMGVDLKIEPTGKNGTVTAEDVRRARWRSHDGAYLRPKRQPTGSGLG